MPSPLLVDPVDSGWDILAAIGDFTGGVFAGGALLVAAVAFKRQVDDARSAQAAKVVARIQAPHLVVENYSALPVYDLVVATRAASGGPTVADSLERLDEHDRHWHVPVASAAGAVPREAWVAFTDSAGVRWVRYADGRLRHKHR